MTKLQNLYYTILIKIEDLYYNFLNSKFYSIFKCKHRKQKMVFSDSIWVETNPPTQTWHIITECAKCGEFIGKKEITKEEYLKLKKYDNYI